MLRTGPQISMNAQMILEHADRATITGLLQELNRLRDDMVELERQYLAGAGQSHADRRKSASNLLNYLAMRRRDIRHLQEALASLGLSSLGRAESHALVSVDAVLAVLRQLARCRAPQTESSGAAGFAEGKALLDAHTKALLGPKPAGRDVRIMVTMPSEAANEYALVRELVTNGMDCMRINCAYDSPAAWAGMISNLRRAESELGRKCRILMDLAGPKLRTGPITPGPRVVKWRPRRNALGNVVEPARIWLTPLEEPKPAPGPADASLELPRAWLKARRTGDRVKFFDARGSSRSMRIRKMVGPSLWAESRQTVYLTPGAALHAFRKGALEGDEGEASVGELPALGESLVLETGDELVLTKEPAPGKPARRDRRGRLLSRATISVTLPDVFSYVRPGEAVWLDDGKIGGVIKSADANQFVVEITHARKGGARLGSDKGINLPDSDLRLPAMTAKDRDDLRFIAENADIVGYSFVRSEADVRELQSRLVELGGKDIGIVLKIETRRAFEKLPDLLLAAMASPSAGVMIARGDLAVECGWERMAEVQEEVLWIAEAAHMPVIWATQVLEALAKRGLPSRAEITDAAMGERAECVMLNKGPFIVEAVRTLDDILRRMQNHQTKKSSMLRHLSLADRFLDGHEVGQEA